MSAADAEFTRADTQDIEGEFRDGVNRCGLVVSQYRRQLLELARGDPRDDDYVLHHDV